MDQTWHCVNCGQDFKTGAWFNCEGNPARKHVVERRTFYSQHDRYQVNVVPETRVTGNQGQLITVPGLIVTFYGGLYDTSDPEVQEVLSRLAPMTKEQYMDMRMTPELKSARQRQTIAEQQELIAQLKAKNAELEKKAATPAEPEEEEVTVAAVPAVRTRRKPS